MRILAELGVLPNRLAPAYSIMHAFYPYDQIRRYEDELHSRLPARATPSSPPPPGTAHWASTKASCAN
ncbi:hypothetical protein [Neisseria bacilliformis]|uniref:hypothetical protein n=1 Tax=Neisseria bacilliformis TaxID=267212 RepID=UPI000ADE4623|nr:hypothetical protein [Neisseria bacilliformis]